MHADVGDPWRTAGEQGDLDPLAIAGRGEGGGGSVVALDDVGLELEKDVGEILQSGSVVVSVGERRRV